MDSGADEWLKLTERRLLPERCFTCPCAPVTELRRNHSSNSLCCVSQLCRATTDVCGGICMIMILSDGGTGPQSKTIILTTTQRRNLPSNRCYGPFVEPLARSPTIPICTAIYMAIQLLGLPLSFFHLSLVVALSLALCLYIYIPPPASPSFSPLAVWNQIPILINFDQSRILICLAEETVTYWCRFSYTDVKKARRPVSQNVSVLTQTFTPHFIFSHCLSQKSQIYPKNFYLLRWLIAPSSPSRCGREGFIMITIPGIRVYICFLTNRARWYKMLCTAFFSQRGLWYVHNYRNINCKMS